MVSAAAIPCSVSESAATLIAAYRVSPCGRDSTNDSEIAPAMIAATIDRIIQCFFICFPSGFRFFQFP